MKRVNILSVDLGGTSLRVSFVNRHGEISNIEKYDISALKKTENTLENFITNAVTKKIKETPIDAACIAVPWVIENKQIDSCVTNFSESFSLEILKKHIERKHIPVFFINDVNAATLGEQWKGMLQNVNVGAYINIGTGISMGVIINKRLHLGHNALSGEIAFCLSSLDEVKQNKKKHAFLEHHVGGERAKNILKSDNVGKQQFYELLVLHILNICFILDPEYIVLGGGVIYNVPDLYAFLNEEIKKRLLPNMNFNLVKSSIGDEVGLLGCGHYSLQRLHMS